MLEPHGSRRPLALPFPGGEQSTWPPTCSTGAVVDEVADGPVEFGPVTDEVVAAGLPLPGLSGTDEAVAPGAVEAVTPGAEVGVGRRVVVVAGVPLAGARAPAGVAGATPRLITPGAGTAERWPTPATMATKNSSEAARTAAAAFIGLSSSGCLHWTGAGVLNR